MVLLFSHAALVCGSKVAASSLLSPSQERGSRRRWAHSSFFFFFFQPYPTACGTLIPQPGIEPAPPVLEGGVLTIGLPGKSLSLLLRP